MRSEQWLGSFACAVSGGSVPTHAQYSSGGSVVPEAVEVPRPEREAFLKAALASPRVLRHDANRSAKRLWHQESRRQFKMNMSQRAMVSFTDVAASFSEEEWDLLEEWQRDLYKDVMREIHSVLQDLGYRIENSDILFRIVREEEPVSGDHRAPGSSNSKEDWRPDILLRINDQGLETTSSETEDSEGVRSTTSETGFTEGTSDLLLNIKQEEELYCSNPYDSQAEMDRQCPSPVEPKDEPSYREEIKEEKQNLHHSDHEDSANDPTSNEEIKTEWSPRKTRQGSKISSSGETSEPAPRGGARRRKGIARKIKPGAALHDSHQNKQTEPKENELDELDSITECESSFSGIKFPIPAAEEGEVVEEEGEAVYPYTAFEKGFGDDAPISFHQRGQTFIICSVCGKTFCNNSSFQVHMRTHTGERPYKCTDCEKSFIRSSHLKIHLRTHTGERPYQCTECEKSFRDNSSFARHQRIHTGEKPYQCAVCGKYFRKKSNLKDHQRTHTGEKPYKCRYCDKCFHQRSNLRVHEKTQHVGNC